MEDLNGLKLALQKGLATIDFTKVNGHKRQMVATLEASLLPPPKPGRVTTTKDDSLLVVYDVESAGWRTIKVDSISKWVAGEEKTPVPAAPAPVVGNWAPANPTPTPAAS